MCIRDSSPCLAEPDDFLHPQSLQHRPSGGEHRLAIPLQCPGQQAGVGTPVSYTHLRQDQTAPDEVTVESQDSHLNLAAEGAELTGGRIDLMGQVYINGEKLEELIARIAAMMMG